MLMTILLGNKNKNTFCLDQVGFEIPWQVTAKENDCNAADDQNKSTFLFSIHLGGLFISIHHTIQSSHSVMWFSIQSSLLTGAGSTGCSARQFSLLPRSWVRRSIVDSFEFVSSKKYEDFDVEKDQGAKRDNGSSEKSEPHTVVGYIRGGPSVISMPKSALKILYTTDAKGYYFDVALASGCSNGGFTVLEKHRKSLLQHCYVYIVSG